jgi:hypothetical protein
MRRTPRQAAVAACAITAALALGACGDDRKASDNTERPPTPIVVSASIDDKTVDVSPKKVGAGPITLIISNQSSASQRVTLETNEQPGDSGPGRKAIETGPINPRETASVKGQVTEGTYALRVGGDGVKPATIKVGKERTSAQNELLQP